MDGPVTIRSLSFDDEDEEALCVFSGYDLMISHYDIADLDWREVAERSSIDERRGLVIAQVAAIEDLIDEFSIYLDDPVDAESYQRGLDTQTIGPRLGEPAESRLGYSRSATGFGRMTTA